MSIYTKKTKPSQKTTGKRKTLQKLNKQAEEAYIQAGIHTVVPIPINIKTLQGEGSLNCITFEQRKQEIPTQNTSK